jgi:flagellar hook-associated protein 2
MSMPEASLTSLWNNPTLLQGLIPGVNVQAMQAALQAEEAQAAAPLQQLSQDQQTLSAQAQAYSQVQSALSQVLQDAQALELSSAFAQTAAPVSSNPSVVTASAEAGSQPPAGVYSVQVTALASPAVLSTQSLTTDPTAALGWSGSLTITVNAGLSQTPVSFTVNVSSTESLNDVAQAIDSAAAFTLPQGTVLSAVVLPTSTSSGQGYVLSLSVNGGLTSSQISTSGSIPALTWTQTSTYSPASFTVNGVPNQSTSNVATGAIPGVDLTLLTTGSAQITVGANPQATASQVQQLVNDISSAVGIIQKQTGKGGPLEGDAALNALVQQLETLLSSQVPGQPAGYSSLTDMGLTESYSQTSGMSISFSSSTFEAALTANPSAVSSLFTTQGSGLAWQIANLVQTYTAPSTGILASDQTAIQNQEQQLANEEQALQQSINLLQQNLQAQFQTDLKELVQNLAQVQLVQAWVNQITGSSGSSGSGSGQGNGLGM